MNNEKYWEAMELYNAYLRGETTERELYKDPEVAEMLRETITPAIKRYEYQRPPSVEH